MSNEYSKEKPACNSRASSWNTSSAVPPFVGARLFSRSIWPQPSLLFGMSGVPRSSAPLTRVALMRLADGLLIPATSRRYSRASAAEPPATAVAWEVPLNSMYIERVLLCVPVAQTEPIAFLASSARAEQIPSPGATISGLIRPSSVGP